MKKSSLMGASVVAAALLAAAPIAAPVANIATGTQTVQAAVTDPHMNEVAQKVKSMSTSTSVENNGTVYGSLTDFTNQLVSVTDLGSLRSKPAPFPARNVATANDVMYLNELGSNWSIMLNAGKTHAGVPTQQVAWLLKYFFSGQNQINLASKANLDAAAKMSYTLGFDYSNAISNVAYPITDVTDVARAQNDLKTNGGTITMSMQLYDGNGDSMGDAGLLKSNVSYKTFGQRAAYINYNSALSAHVGDSAEIFGLSNSFMNANGTIRNYNGDDITKAAYDAGAISVSQLRSTNYHPGSSTDFVNGNFAKTGTYYQHVAIKLGNVGINPGTDSKGVPDWEDAAANGLITVNGQVPSTTNADADVYLVTNNNKAVVDGLTYAPGTLVMKRTVDVSKADLAAKEDKVDGIVTVNTPSSVMAQLYTKDGSPISDRALPSGSNWKTDLKRTVYANGEVYYRVSTNEYVKASQVSFSEKPGSTSTSSATESGNVVVTPASGVFTMDTLGSLLWTKANDNQSMSVIADRYLPASSQWRVDQKAVVNGKTFYRVSTNEWVNADHGSLN
ncbi:MAG: SLAP domain-containing protein [Lactobacillus sp.]|nr:SLAP domain-containing protein [Lactobacillus sp.]